MTGDPLVARMRPHRETVFASMTALATRTGAINLGQGFPDTDGPVSMLNAAKQAIDEGRNQYPPGRGVPELRAAVAADRLRRYGHSLDPETDVLITVGATEGVSATLLALCEAGDEVLVIEPYYDSYPAAVALAGARMRTVALRPSGVEGAFALNTDELRAAVGPRTRAVLINSPHNPTGSVLDWATLTSIAELCVERDLIAITDEVYEHLTFDGAEHAALATLPGMVDRTVSVSSAGKTFAATGWKVGWVCGSARLIDAVNAVKQFLTYSAAAPFQFAVAHALNAEQDWIEQSRGILQAGRDRLTAGLRAAGFGVHPSAGTYFVQADVRPLGIADATELAWSMPAAVGVAAVPTSAFYAEPGAGSAYLRFAFCKREQVLDEAVERLRAARF